MDKSYNKFKNDWSKSQFYFNLKPLEKRAVALGNLNYQVGNGGFTQWIDNGYAEISMPTLNFITEEVQKLDKDFPELKKALSMVDEVWYNATHSPSEFAKNADSYDDSYYALKNLEKEMNSYLELIKELKK